MNNKLYNLLLLAEEQQKAAVVAIAEERLELANVAEALRQSAKLFPAA